MNRRRQSGLATVEFAIVGLLFLILLLGIIEIARALFVWNTFTEATRRGARVAAVCPVGDAKIERITIFNDPGSSADSSILHGLGTADIDVEYLDANGSPLDCGGAIDCAGVDFLLIHYVRVSIDNYQHELLMPPPFNITLTAPRFETTLPRESLGVVPGVGTQC